jgi:hypothetical protein
MHALLSLISVDVVPIYQDNKSNNPKVEITLVTFAAKQTASSTT